MRTTRLAITGVLALTLITAACGSTSTTLPAAGSVATSTAGSDATSVAASAFTPAGSPTSTTATPAVGAVDPNAPEVVEPGDIPDNQVFVEAPGAGGSFSIKVPEGWARTEQSGIVTFTDKYNSVSVRSHPSAAPPTIESVTATGLADVTTDPTFSITDVAAVTRTAGTGVVATYQIGSAPNTVTGKKALLAVERYFFAHNGVTVVLTLSGAKGADNVDPWKIVSDSLRWT